MAVSEMRHFTKGELIMHEKGNGGILQRYLALFMNPN